MTTVETKLLFPGLAGFYAFLARYRLHRPASNHRLYLADARLA